MKTQLFNRFAKLILLLFLATGMFSCYKDRFDLNKIEKNNTWSPDVAAPLVYTSLTMKDVLDNINQSDLHVNDTTNLLYLVYWNKVYSKTAEQLLGIPNQNVNSTFQFSVTGALPFGTDLTASPYTSYYSFTTPNNFTINNITLLSGTFDFVTNISGFNHNATINVSIPTATLGGIPFSQNINITGSSTTTSSINLSGYNIVFDNTGLNHNRLAIIYTVTVHGQGGTNNSPYTANMGESFNNIMFQDIHGDFKQLAFNFPGDSVSIGLFDKTINGTVDFEDPRVYVFATNSFGMPININLNNLTATAGISSPVAITGVPIPWSIAAAPSLGDSSITEFGLNRTNSTIYNAIAILPKYVTTDITGMSNPSGAPASNFATALSRFDINAQVELPLYGKCNIVLQDTTSATFGTDIDNAEYIEFRLNTQNGFPAQAITQLFFVDSLYHVLDSLLTPEQEILGAALAGGAPDYRVYQSTHALTDIIFVKSRIEGIKNTKRIIIRGKLATSQNGNQIVKFYNDYSLEVRLAARVKFDIQF